MSDPAKRQERMNEVTDEAGTNPTICQVCGKHEAVGVACSATGPLSIAYCQECAGSRREPYWALVASLSGTRDMDEVGEWYKPVIEATLKAEGKTVEELLRDVRQAEQEYAAAM